MAAIKNVEGLSEVIGRAIQEHLERSNINVDWPQIDGLVRPILRVEAFLEDAGPGNTLSPRSEKVASSHSSDVDEDAVDASDSRRKGTGGLRISQNQIIQEDHSEHQRQMQVDTRNFPKRKKIASEKFVFQPSTLDKLIIGIWEQLHSSINLDPKAIFEQFQIAPAASSDIVHHNTADVTTMNMRSAATDSTHDSFSQMNVFCRKVTQASRVCRSIEMIVQARWTELFEEQIQVRVAAAPELSATKHRKAIFMEACQDFGWTEKELRNKMAIWRGYKEVKDAAGWAALVFAGMGIYRYCKYRVGFDKDAMRRLRNLRKRLEVAADTLHPHWRELLLVVGEPQTLKYPGHPHEWVVFETGADPVPLRQTYQDHDPYFAFEHIDESIIDESAWGCEDPRWMPQPNSIARTNSQYTCASCGEQQSDEPNVNGCFCFPSLFGCAKRKPPPVQVFRTPDGKNNGLVALTSFERGAAVGELVGLITKGMRDLDVMDSSTPLSNYQIWQGRIGNYTRFANHSCKANAQSSTFTWLDTQRIVIVSKGIEAGAEITLDYGDKYWAGLDKACLCGEACCRYRTRAR
ncbi:putative RNA helicase [Ascochyta clinopodiicola]|nr:putative RNA helicase [Ascochyta clinopodiicola]